MMTQTADEVSLIFLRYVILHYGIPNAIATDQGLQFMGDVFRKVCKVLKIHKLNTTAYHPESNDWDKWIPFACFAYNTTPHTMTKYTPYEILFGRKANIPGQLQQKTAPLYNYDDFVHDVKQKLQACHEVARANLMQSKQQRVAQHAKEVKMPSFQKGD